MSDAPASNRVLVVDLSTRLGSAALGSVLPKGATGGPWLGLPVPGLPGNPVLDWYHPESTEELPTAGPATLGLYVIVGPGSASRLPAVLAQLAGTPALETLFLLAPNALMESLYLRQHAARLLPGAEAVLLQLPNSDPQALWMILLEQLDNLLRRTLVNPGYQPRLNGEDPMSSNLKQSMDLAMAIDGAVAAALVDYRSGMCLAQAGSGMNLDLAAAGNTEVVRAKLRTLESLGMRGSIEDILITLQHQYHLIRLMPVEVGLFLYLALDRQRGNLALARYKLTEIERNLKV